MSASSVPQRLTRILFWLALCLALGGSVALDIIVAPTIFSTARRLQVQIPDLPASVIAPNYLGGQTFGDVLTKFAYVEDTCIAILIIDIIWETFFRLKRTSPMAIMRILFLIPLLATTILFGHAANQVRANSDAWLLALRQNSPRATEILQLREYWHHASTNIEIIRLLSLLAIAALSAWGLSPKLDKSQLTPLT